MARGVGTNETKSKSNETDKRKTFPYSTHSDDKDLETKSIDLVSVNSATDSENDNISIADGYMQRWHFPEFRSQFLSSFAAILILFACSILNSWSINEYLKLMLDVRGNTSDEWNSTENVLTEYEIVDQIFTSETAFVSAIIVSYNLGVILGGVFGAFIVPVLPNQVVYVSINWKL